MIPIMLLLFLANFAKAQQKYYAFNFNGKYGITDTLGNEALKPSYKYITAVPAKNQIYLQDFSEKPDIIFNTKTGIKQLYESIYDNKVKIKNVPYSIVKTKGKSYLLSEETDKIIPITRDYDEFKNVGKYIVAKYSLQDPFVSGGINKSGIPQPPKIREMKNYFVVLTNDENLKTMVDKGFNKYLLLYKIPQEIKDDGIVRVQTIVLQEIDDNLPNFDYIVLSNGNNHKLYNEKMVLIKAFILAKANEEMLLDFCKKTLKLDLDVSSNEYIPTMSAAPMAIGMGRPTNDNPNAVEKKPFESYFYVKKLENGNTIFALQETEQVSKHIFEANSKAKVELDKRKHTLTISLNGKNQSEFNFDPKTGAIYLPKAYLTLLGIQIIQ